MGRGKSIKFRVGIIVFVLILFVVHPEFIFAETHYDKYDKMYSNCVNGRGGLSNGTMSFCTTMVIEKIAKELETKLVELQRNDSSLKKEIMQNQKLWEDYIESHCKLESEFVGGPMYYLCRMTRYVERSNELDALLGK